MVEIGLCSLGVPLLVSIVVSSLASFLLPEDAAKRYAFSSAAAFSFLVGYVLLPSWAAMVPERHWQWLPYLAIGSAVLGPIGWASGVSRVERWLVICLLSVVAACLLVPTWDSLQPSRMTLVPLAAVYFVVLIVALEARPATVSPRFALAALAFTAFAVAVLTTALISIRYGRLGIIAASGLLGCCLAAHRQGSRFSDVSLASLLSMFVVLVGGAALVAGIDPDPPLYGLLLAAAAPAALSLRRFKRLAQLSSRQAAVLQTILLLLPLTIAFAWLWIAG